MRPTVSGPAHHTGDFAELVCSTSLKSDDPTTAAGVLKRELAALGSLVLAMARRTAVPAGAALAVDRTRFSAEVTRVLESTANITIERSEARDIPSGDVIVAAGPLPSASLETALSEHVGAGRLAFYDAAAPIVEAASIDRTRTFVASRWGKGEGDDYLNCPMDGDQYEAFCAALVAATRATPKDFERRELFSACQPIEEIARTGPDALRFGALKPVGLVDPDTSLRPWAVVQLRAENRERTAYNLVGFQTNLTFGEQRRVFGMVPALAHAEFLRFGVMHRNSFVDAPRLLTSGFALRTEPRIHVAGQLAGTEGYLEAAATGIIAALDVARRRASLPTLALPRTTALGALVAYATDPATQEYQPMHVNFGLVPPLVPPVRGKRARYAAYAERADADLAAFLATDPWPYAQRTTLADVLGPVASRGRS
jgi:methylenetetrahydrofolate--tRNA-(uracil-5-)-methyltransferase